MRQIEKRMNLAVLQGKDWRCKNTAVTVLGDVTYVVLHGSCIATIDRGSRELILCLCGWNTVTTRSRLNAILASFGKHRGFTQRHYTPLYRGAPVGLRDLITVPI
jgi:hypothetical protein